MNATARPGTPGAARACPHCRATILESASVCPACHGHLRFDPAASSPVRRRASPLQVEGTLAHAPSDGVLEYTVLLAIRDERGDEIARHVVGIGALRPDEKRTFSLTVEVGESTGGKAARAREQR